MDTLHSCMPSVETSRSSILIIVSDADELQMPGYQAQQRQSPWSPVPICWLTSR
jgi:hypothetical protein